MTTRLSFIKRVLNKLDVTSLFYVSLPKKRQLVSYAQKTNFLTIGLTNMPLFDINIPVLARGDYYRIAYSLSTYDYYRLGYNFRQSSSISRLFFKLTQLSTIFFKR